MALQSVGHGMVYPVPVIAVSTSTFGAGAVKTVDAADERAALIGHLLWADGGSHTVSAAGGGKVSFRTGTVTWANAATSLNVGIQGVASATGPQVRPDDTWKVYATLTPANDTLASNSWKDCTMETGSATLADGDLISVVLDMTARGGTDSVTWYTLLCSAPGRPTSNVYLSGAWQNASQNELPVCYITADDGTLGVIHGGLFYPFAVTAGESYQDATNPDERGLVFTPSVPMRVKGIVCLAGSNSATSDWQWTLYTNPTSSPTPVIGPRPILAEQLAYANGRLVYGYSDPYDLTAGTQYCLAIRATGTTNLFVAGLAVPDSGLRVFLPGGANTAKATRNNGTGAFDVESPALTLYSMGLLVTHLDDGSGGGGGGIRLAGHGGLAA